MIIILSGEPGSGKTFQAMGWEEPILYLDMENRTQKTLDNYYSDKVITIKKCMAYTKEYKEDHVVTLQNFEREIKGLEEARTVVIDGISDIRDYAATKWTIREKRKRPMNPGDWEQINDIVRDLLFPLINQCRIKEINLVMTAQFKDDYALDSEGKSSKIGRIPALKDWISYNVDSLITLEYRKPHYRAVCNKSLMGCFEENITSKNLYDILIEKGV
ncbi:MAG: AAA family ATPase [Ignavibacteria bacterium]|nr:AAA family ATPase [Ignavibacteria bacterium]